MSNRNKRNFKKGKIGDRFRTVELNNDNLHKKNKKEFTKIAILVVFLFVSVIGTSYAFFKVLVTSNKETEIVAGTFKVEFEEGNEIHLSNLAPMSDSEGMATDSYHFTIKNTGTINAKYNLSLEEMVANSNSLDKKYIKYSMKMGDGSWTEPRLLSDGLLLDSGSLGVEVDKKEVSYDLKMWLREDADNSVQGKTFSARIVVSAVQDNTKVEDIIDSTTPIIRLNGENTIYIEQGTSYEDPGISEVIDDKDQIPTSSVHTTYTFLNNGVEEEVETIDTTRLGTYFTYYRVTDSNNNTGISVRSVNIIKHNTEAPTILLNGDSIVKVLQGNSYQELGAHATDYNNKDITNQIKISGTVNTKVLGTYIIKYIVNDMNGNTASISRTIIVEKKGTIHIATTEPVIHNNKGTFDITVSALDGKVNGYLFTMNHKKPTTKEFKKVEETDTFTTTETVTKNGVYYIWAKDTNGNVVSKEIKMDGIDDRKPICKFSNVKYFGLNTTQSIHLVCSDESDLKTKYLTENDFIIDNNKIASIENISGIQKVEGGIQYTLDIKGKALGEFTITLKNGVITDIYSNTNQKTTSETLEVSDILIDKEEITLDISKSNTHQIKVSENKGPVSYLSSDSNIVTVNENGQIEAKSPGKATITVTDTASGAFKTLLVNVEKTISVQYVKQGRGVISITDSSHKEATTGSCKLTDSNKDSCVITSLPVIEVKEGYEALGWNSNSNAHDGSLKEIVITESIQKLYSISKKNSITLKATWNKNSNTLSDDLDGKESTCDIPEVYNEEEIIDNSCTVQAPTITANINTPIVLGFSNHKLDHENILLKNAETLTLTEENTNRVWYAQTSSESIPLKVTYIKQGIGVEQIFDQNHNEIQEDSCIPEAVYNGEIQVNSCDITLPTASMKDNYTWIGWNEDKDSHEGVNETFKLKKDTKLYSISLRNRRYLTANFAKNGIGVDTIGSSTLSCSVDEEYNADEDITSCTVNMPTITVKDNYEALGWSRNSNAKESREDDPYGIDTYIPINKGKIMLSIENTGNTYYSISKTGGIDLGVIWSYNGANQLLDSNHNVVDNNSTSTTCHLPVAYNNEEATSSCDIPTPTIERSGFDIVGFYTDKDLKEGNESLNIVNAGDSLTLTPADNGMILYAITKKKIDVKWEKNGATSIGATQSSCTIYNNSTVCEESLSAPDITRDSFEMIGWNRDSKAITSEWDDGKEKSISLDDLKSIEDSEITYYAITKKDVTISFDRNANGQIYIDEHGNSIKPSGNVLEKTCTIYNSAKNCGITSPIIEVNANTPTVVGYSTDSNRHQSDWDINTLKQVDSSLTYYAQTLSEERTYHLIYHQNGSGVTSISESSKSCKIDATYNGEKQETSCSINPLATMDVKEGYTSLGWSQNPNATKEASDGVSGYIPQNGTISLSDDADYYSISKKDAITYTATFDKNGSASQTYRVANEEEYTKEDDTIPISCEIPEVYNSEEQNKDCLITTPKINASTNTPVVKGYSKDKNATTGDVSENTQKSISNNITYYAITEKPAEQIRGTFNINGAESFVYNDTLYTGTTTILLCTKEPSYNGEKQKNCIAGMPKINPSDITPTVIGWSEAENNHNKKYDSEQEEVSLENDVVLYAQTYKKEKQRTVEDYKIGTHVSSIGDKTDHNSKCIIDAIYNGNDGVEQSDSCTVTPPKITPDDDYIAIGWSTKDGNGEYNDENANPIVLDSKNTGKEWYARASNTYMFEYYSEGKKIGQKADIDIDMHTTLDLSTSHVLKDVLVKNGYTFKGWSKNSSATTVDYQDGVEVTDLTPHPGEKIKFYAVWVDDQGPICRFEPISSLSMATKEKIQVGLTCTDVNDIERTELSVESFSTTTSNGTVTEVSTPEREGDNGYRYVVTVQGESVGEFGIHINEGSIADTLGNTNILTTSSDLSVHGITYTVKFSKNGVGVSGISSTDISCTTEGSNLTCKTQLPTIMVSDGYTALGWSQNPDATEENLDGVNGYLPMNNEIELSKDNTGKTYYSISKKNAITYTVNFDANGSTISSNQETCTIEEVYNSTPQADSCQINIPTITRQNSTTSESFDIVGFDPNNIETKEKTENTIDPSTNSGINQLTLTSSNNNTTYYALTYQDVNINFVANGAELDGKKGDVTKSCTMYNSDNTCSIEAPTITRETYTIEGFGLGTEDHDNKKKWSSGVTQTVGFSRDYYAQTHYKIFRSIWYSPSNNNIYTNTISCDLWNMAETCEVDISDIVTSSTTSHNGNDYLYGGISTKTNLYNTDGTVDNDSILTQGKSLSLTSETSHDLFAYYINVKNIWYYYYDKDKNSIQLEMDTPRLYMTYTGGGYKLLNSYLKPSVVFDSKDMANNPCIGVANKTSTMTIVSDSDSNSKILGLSTETIASSSNSYFYAVYRSDARINYATAPPTSVYASSGTTSYRDVYKNGYFTSTNNFKNVLSTTSDGKLDLVLEEAFSTIDRTPNSVGNSPDNYDRVPKYLSTSSTNIGSSDRKSVSDLAKVTNTTFYVVYESKIPVSVYYNSNGSITSYTNYVYGITYFNYNLSNYIRGAVDINFSSKTGPYSTKFVGFVTQEGSMTYSTNMNNYSNYYAVYQTPVTVYYDNNGTPSSKTIYRNSYPTSSGKYTTVLSTSSTGTTNSTDNTIAPSIVIGKNNSRTVSIYQFSTDISGSNSNYLSSHINSYNNTLYARYLNTSVPVNFYYIDDRKAYSGDSIERYRESGVSILLNYRREIVSSSDVDVSGTGFYKRDDFIGVTKDLGSMFNYGDKSFKPQMSHINSEDGEFHYYSLYRSSAYLYYYDTVGKEGKSKTLYRNTYIDSDSSTNGYKINVTLTTSDTNWVDFSVSIYGGPGGSKGVGLSTTQDNSSPMSVSNAKLYSGPFYIIYKDNQIATRFYWANEDGLNAQNKSVNGTKYYNYKGKNFMTENVHLPESFYYKAVPQLDGVTNTSLSGWDSSAYEGGRSLWDINTIYPAGNTYAAFYTGSRNFNYVPGSGIIKESLSYTNQTNRPIEFTISSDGTYYTTNTYIMDENSDLPTYRLYDGYEFDGWYVKTEKGIEKVSFPYQIPEGVGGVTLTAKAKDIEAPKVQFYNGEFSGDHINGNEYNFTVILAVTDNNYYAECENENACYNGGYSKLANDDPICYIGNTESSSTCTISKDSDILEVSNRKIKLITYRGTISADNTNIGTLGFKIASGYATDIAENNSKETFVSIPLTIKNG